MAKAYSEDLRERVIAAVDAGATRRAAAVQFKLSISSAIRWVRRWQADWEIAANPRGGSVSPLEHHAAARVALVTDMNPRTERGTSFARCSESSRSSRAGHRWALASAAT